MILQRDVISFLYEEITRLISTLAYKYGAERVLLLVAHMTVHAGVCLCAYVCVCVCSLSYFGSLVLEPDLHNPDAQTSLCCQGLPYLGSGFREGGESGGRGGVKNRRKETEEVSSRSEKICITPLIHLKTRGKGSNIYESQYFSKCLYIWILKK